MQLICHTLRDEGNLGYIAMIPAVTLNPYMVMQRGVPRLQVQAHLSFVLLSATFPVYDDGVDEAVGPVIVNVEPVLALEHHAFAGKPNDLGSFSSGKLDELAWS